MGNKQSYDLAKAQNAMGGVPNEEVSSQQDEYCRPVSMASTSSMRKPPKSRKKTKETDKENLSMGSSRADTASPDVEHIEHREVAIDVPEEPQQLPLVVEEIPSEIVNKEALAPAHSSPYYDQVPVIDEVLVKAYEVPRTDLSVFVNKEATPVTVEEKECEQETEKERAKHVAEEAVKCVEAKRNSRDSNSTHNVTQSYLDSPPIPAEIDYLVLEVLNKEEEVGNVPLEQGGSRSEQEKIDDATKQLDDAIDDIDEIMAQEESAVVLEESAVSEFATVSLALDEDISAIETTHPSTKEIQKLHYTQPLSSHPVDAFPSQSSYIKLK